MFGNCKYPPKYYEGEKSGGYYLINTMEQFKVFYKEALKQRKYAVDTETNGLDWVRSRACGIVIGWGIKHNFYIPIRHKFPDGRPIPNQLCIEDIRADLQEILGDPEKVYFFWNAKFDLHILRRDSLEVKGLIHDGLTVSFLLDENEPHTLKWQSKKKISKKADKWEKEINLFRSQEAKCRRSAFNEEAKARAADLALKPEYFGPANEYADEEVNKLIESGFFDVEEDSSKIKRKRTTLVKRFLKEIAIEELKDHPFAKNKKDDITYDFIPLDIMTPYAAADVHYTLLLTKKLLNQLIKEEEQKDLYINEIQLTWVLFEVEEAGIKVDKEYLRKIIPEMSLDISKAEKEVHEDFGHEFNVGSNQELRQALLSAGIKLKKLTKKGRELKKKLIDQERSGIADPVVVEIKNNKRKEYREVDLAPQFLSVDKEVLENLAAKYPVANSVQQYKDLVKLKNTYADNIYHKADKHDFLHTNFNQNVRTGRMSSSGGINLQNIPGGDKRIRRSFINLDDDHVFIFIDYSQVELRLTAHHSQDPLLLACYPWEGEGVDVHSQTAADIVMKVPYDEFLDMREDYSKHDEDNDSCPCIHCEAEASRKIAKSVNFGIIYGVGGEGLQNQVSSPDRYISQEECKQYIRGYLDRYCGVERWIREEEGHIFRLGYARNSFGRYRRFPGVKSMDAGQRSRVFRQGVNFIIQGDAADLFKCALVRVFKAIQGTNIKIVNLVHDEIQFYWPKKELYVLKHVVEEMEDFDFSVPIKAEIAYSTTSWADKEELKI